MQQRVVVGQEAARRERQPRRPERALHCVWQLRLGVPLPHLLRMKQVESIVQREGSMAEQQRAQGQTHSYWVSGGFPWLQLALPLGKVVQGGKRLLRVGEHR